MTDVHLEVGAKRVFACAVDWPGWCRSAETEAGAPEALPADVPRSARVVPGFDPGDLHVVGRLPGTGAWPVRYAVRRFAWHVLDHAWEIEDRSG
jgi:hypothetical protein